jgi:hypothetical protein
MKKELRTNEIKPLAELLPKEIIGTPFDYSHIELTEEEVEQALNYKRKLKAIAMEEEDKRKATERMIANYRKPWTADELMEEFVFRSQQLPFEFVIDNENQRVIELLCMYFSGDERFNKEVFDYGNGVTAKMNLKKGIGLVSQTKGTGKSVLMSMFQQNKHRPFLDIETKVIAAQFQKKGEDAINVHSTLLDVPRTPTFYYHSKVGICFEDLGFEIAKNNWGSKSDVLADVLFKIYQTNQHKGDYSWFHYTSNLYGQEISNRYDDRIRDRMTEMFNRLVLTGKSRRI